MTTTHDPPEARPSVDPFPLLNALPAAAGVLDAEGALRCANQRMQRLVEERLLPFFSTSETSGPPALLVSGGGAEDILAGLKAVLRGEREKFDVELPSAKGAPRRALSATSLAVDGARGALVCVEDLPPPRREAAAVPIESFFDVILEHIPLTIFIKETKEFRLIRLNRRYEELYGVSRKDLLGKNSDDVLTQKDAEYIRKNDLELLANGKPVDIPEVTINIPGRGEVVCHIQKLPLYDESGAPLYIVCIVEELTERKRAEAARQRELAWIKTQEQLLAVIHELSTPVIPVHQGILVVPLVGHLDAARSEQLTRTLLSGIQQHRAEVVILDITGVPVIDAGVADHLIQATRAASLLGASCVLAGTSPDVARAMIELGIDLGRISTQRDLQASILYALARQGKAIVNSPS